MLLRVYGRCGAETEHKNQQTLGAVAGTSRVYGIWTAACRNFRTLEGSAEVPLRSTTHGEFRVKGQFRQQSSVTKRQLLSS